MSASLKKRQHPPAEDFTVGWICALPVEYAAAAHLLDDEFEGSKDNSTYTIGRIGEHNVVIACFPAGQIGTNVAAVVATQMKLKFPSVQIGLMVGVGGGVPSADFDIRLGDVVVSKPFSTHGGVVQYDFGKTQAKGQFKRTGSLNKPPAILLNAITTLQSNRYRGRCNLSTHLSAFDRLPDFSHENEPDILFEPSYNHVGGNTCENCDRRRSVKRHPRRSKELVVHHGTIASGNQIMRDGLTRDRLSSDLGGVVCFEMEAAGLMDILPSIVIRGICDYADSHKNKRWQPLAAAAATAYAKELLLVIPAAAITMRCSLGEKFMVEQEKQQVYKALLESLSFKRKDARLMNISPAHRKTCLWLFEQTEFNDWHNRSNTIEHHGFLWIKGKPGSGKSTIMKTAYDRARKKQRHETIVAYFFNARAPDLLEKSSLGMYRSLAHQLLTALPYLEHSFTESFLVKERHGEVDEWTVQELQGFLIQVVEGLGKHALTIFIDALDEGQEDDVRQMVAFLEELGQISIDNDTSLSICISSRHYPHISIKKGLSLTVESQPGHDCDISAYVKSQLTGDEGSPTKELRDNLCRKASGVFLWVVLVIPILNKLYDQGQENAMNQRLDEIPERLDDLFAEILARDAENKDKSILLLQWTLFAKRPLSPTELYFAVKAGSGSLQEWSLEIPEGGTIQRYILNCSKGLTEVSRSEPSTVQFIHETVRDFLLQRNGLAKVQPDLSETIAGSSQDQLASCCFQYLSRMEDPAQPVLSNSRKRKRAGKSEDKRLRESKSTQFPFLEYAIIHMFSHADAAEGSGVSQKAFLRRFLQVQTKLLEKWIYFRNIFQRHRVRQYTAGAKLLYIVAEHNLSNLV
ncbi:purine and uridine phosphorylase, partial [Glonium stellatum]